MSISSIGECEDETERDQSQDNEELKENTTTLKKSMRTMSRSTFDSIIDDYIEDDWEKRSALGVSMTVVIILTTFLFLLFAALSVSLGVQHGNQSRKIAFNICSKERKQSAQGRPGQCPESSSIDILFVASNVISMMFAAVRVGLPGD